MKAIILHGRPPRAEYYDEQEPSCSNAHWYPWLQKQLLIRNIAAATPEVPLAYDPLWQRWVKEVERFDINKDTMLIGHSCGGGFWVRYLSEHPDIEVDRVVLVAPWIDVEGDAPNDFFKFTLDPKIVKRTRRLTIIHSLDDAPEIISSVDALRQKLTGFKYIEFKDKGHFTNHDHTDTSFSSFPELLKELTDEL